MRHWPVLLAVATLLAAVPARSAPVWTDAAGAQALIDAVSKTATPGAAAVDTLAGLMHLQVPTTVTAPPGRPPFAQGPAGVLVSAELQLAMTQLSIHIGTNNQLRVLRAQNGARDALILQSGAATLRDLAKAAEAQGIDGLRMVNGAARLTRPLVVWLGAGLRLEPGDRLEMEAASGAFLLGFGQVEMIGAQVAATGVSTLPESYRPFVLITGQGTIHAENTRFTGLGMVNADPFGGVMISQRGLFAPPFAPALLGNEFEDMGVVGMSGVTGGFILGNVIRAGRGGGVALAAAQDTAVSGNRIIATKGGAGVKVANGTAVRLTGNLVTGGARNGISVGGNSKGILISGNAVLSNAETGIATQRATCVLVTGNSIAKNGASGLRLNESGVSRVQGNALVMNTTAGLHVGAQTKGGRIEISDNLLAANRVGLTGVAIGEVMLEHNNLSAQMPRLFDGEFSQYLAGYLTGVQQKSDTNFRIAPRDGRQADAFLTACNKG